MQIGKKALSLSLVALLLEPMVGCLGGSSAATPVSGAGPSGKAIQGAVSGATIWADATSTGTKFVIDTAEAGTKTTTSSSGAYTLPVTPNYKYVIVSQGGTDTITGKPADTLVAPGGSATVSPLTTLVAFDPTGNLATTLNSLLPPGTTYASDFTTAGGLTPSMMVLLTAITTAVTTLDAAITDATGSSATLTSQQTNNINLAVYSQIATQFAGLSAATLSDTATLASNLQTALTTAVTNITTSDSNITGLNASAIGASVASSSVVSAANVVGLATGNTALTDVTAGNLQSTPVTTPTAGTVTESTVLTPSSTSLIDSTITSGATSASSGVTVSSTPASYTPPTLPLIQNPTVIGYSLAINASSNAWNVSSFTITFSDDMVATASGAHSVLNSANYTFSQPGCSPTSYANDVVTFTCTTPLGAPSNFVVSILSSTSTSGVWASATSLGLPVTNTKTFALPSITGSTGGSSLTLF